MIYSLFFILILLFFSASFSGFETALFSLTRHERDRLRMGGGFSTLIEKVLARPSQLLTTLLLGNEVVNVAISILAGGIAYDWMTGHDIRFVHLITVIVTTFVLLVFGEILPKNVAIRNRLPLSQALILPYQLFSWLVTPLRIFLTRVTERFVALFGAEPVRRLIVEEELTTLLEMGRREGTLAELEGTLIQNTLDFSGIQVSRIMTPRERIVAVPETFSLTAILEVMRNNRFSRIPVYRDRLDQVIGILHAKELLHLKLNQEKAINPSEIVKTYAPLRPEQSLSEVFEEFKKLRVHIGLVRRADQQIIGLVTMDDLLGRLFP